MSTNNLSQITLAHISICLDYFVLKEKLFLQLENKINESPMKPVSLEFKIPLSMVKIVCRLFVKIFPT